MRSILGRGVQRALNHLRDLRIAHRARPAHPILVGQPFNTGLRKTTPPLSDCVFVNPEPLGNLLALQSVRAQQDHTAAVR